jgi:hypothetical protein
MIRKIKPGVRCRIIGVHEQTDNPVVYRAIVGKGPNVGTEVTVVRLVGEDDSLGNIWRVDAGSPRIVLYWGYTASEADIAECLLEVIDDSAPVKSKEATACDHI